METNEIIAALRNCVTTQFSGCKECPAYCRSANCLNRLHTAAADTIEALQKRIEELAKELESYREAEKTGLLLRLPCPIGSKIYILARRKDGGGHIYAQTLMGAHLRDEHSRRCLRRKEYIVVRGGEGFSNHLDMDKQGVVWFTDYATAKAALEGNA